jgi:hypothetical protein
VSNSPALLGDSYLYIHCISIVELNATTNLQGNAANAVPVFHSCASKSSPGAEY